MKKEVAVQDMQTNTKLSGWKTSFPVRLLLLFALMLIICMSLFSRLIPQTFDIKLGAVAEKNIYAPFQIENSVATEKAKEDAAKKLQPVYKIVNLRNEAMIDAIYDRILQINADPDVKFEDKVSVYRTVIPAIIADTEKMAIRTIGENNFGNDTLIDEINSKVSDQKYRIPEEIYYKFPRLTKEDVAAMAPITREIVSKLMSDQISDAQTARAKVAELVNSSDLSKNTLRELVQEIARVVITPNKFLDQKATDDARGEVRENVKPVYINQGDIIVNEGDVITDEIYKRLKAAELLKEKANYWPHVGLVLLGLLFVAMIYLFVRQSTLPIRTNNSQLLMFVLIFAINMIGMKVVALGQNPEYPFIGYLAPAAIGSMLITILLNPQLAFIASVLFSIMSSIIFNMHGTQLFDYRYGLVTLVTCFASVFVIQKASQRSSILKAGILISFIGMITIVSLMLLDNVTRQDMLYSLSFSAASGILTAVFVIGLLPFFETAFGILSPLKLVELSNPNHPLLRKLLTETPGTYHHSIMVGNLAESAAESIGADGLLCRVGSYYHDIGKTKRPSYFIENQTNIENPHDRIDPALSKSIITAHARDGVEMLKEYNIPKPIRDIAEQHHGTTLLTFFYHKARKLAEEEGREVREEDFRYEGPKAQCKEAAVVGIADCVEAAVRSLRNPTIEQIDTMVRKIIKSRLDDGQFNDCDLTLKELDTIAKTLNESLLGIFHSRIEYPSELPAKAK
ncbi:HD family phosphohydrolase [Paenibacillus chitinolyticus]|uniref:HD family phosphohydrolase n=1 Tax=Paenibacillus chitinolyticus TaxID=79263 RepID=UPI0026E4CFF3|nr:HDIG domain-containing metalloprotein [Paenibacillus chitinolyticus]GKS12456.1 cyclic-di-AMP phosphodiesterase PgpH [Paenibacillus chitinolyticus]